MTNIEDIISRRGLRFSPTYGAFPDVPLRGMRYELIRTSFSRAVLHESSRYPDPLRFNPGRYADEKRNKELGINEFPLAAFGFGRRSVYDLSAYFIVTY